MLTGIIGTKMKQTQTFTKEGVRIPVTVVSVGPCTIIDTKEINGKTHIQLALGTAKHINKAQEGLVKKAGLEIKPRFLRDVIISDLGDLKIGQDVVPSAVFAEGDVIRVTGVSKGKGFAGVMKRHGFHGGPATHGQSDRARAPGSIGATTTPGRVFKGKRMAGRMGGDRITVKGLRIIAVDDTNKTLTIKGLVPGGKEGVLVIQKEQ